ncbi:hypothetical protein Asulf_01381 [Archaeoglobus sulfaticallidus PM70-1]|uniref:Uncharacterized protein n=1 Tax=Archaeoglobus sulfaticallidus PM70-1 TaxID=387631 RepID=N0BGE9_9EURY|nr:hypothetical protein Asulf_01381 [Archaeoglobus sulfaticallidus PM70-1]
MLIFLGLLTSYCARASNGSNTIRIPFTEAIILHFKINSSSSF